MTPGQPLATVFIPCYNYGHYVAECVQSVLDQTLQDFEILVINDGSTDSSADVVRGFNDPRIRYIEHPNNLGLLATLTEGFSEARGRYVTRIDADDRYRSTFLEATIAILEARPHVGLVYSDVALIDESGTILEDPWLELQSNQWHHGADSEGDEFLTLVRQNLIPTAAVIARRDAWLRALPFPAWFEYSSISDWYLNVNVTRHHPVYYLARTLGDYRFHPRNLHAQAVDVSAVERTIIRILDEVFAGSDRIDQKQKVKNPIYGHAYEQTGNRYFGAANNRDARRSYLQAVRRRPSYLLDAAFVRRLCATAIRRDRYERWKRRASSMASLWSDRRNPA
jgi:glycosyltransferase involved in cell wall biosynthesis